jgi:hypothetical protein
MATQAHTPNSTSLSTSWRNFVAHVRADAIELGSAEVAQFIADNPGEFATEQEAVDAYRADHAFLCPILGHWFRFEDGVEIRDGWVHVDALTIGYNDPSFDYGNPGEEAARLIEALDAATPDPDLEPACEDEGYDSDTELNGDEFDYSQSEDDGPPHLHQHMYGVRMVA